MKTTNLILLLALILFTFSCKEKIDIEKEAIKAVIEEETSAFIAQDTARLNATYIHDESVIRLMANKKGYQFLTGWKSIRDSINGWMLEDWGEFKAYVKNTEYKIKIYQTCAWAVFIQSTELTYQGKSKSLSGIETRILEKTDNGWKIVYLGGISKSSYETPDNQKDSTDILEKNE